MVGLHLFGVGPDRETVRSAAVARARVATPKKLASAHGGAGGGRSGHAPVFSVVAARLHRRRAKKAPGPAAAISIDHDRQRVLPFRRSGGSAESNVVLDRRADP